MTKEVRSRYVHAWFVGQAALCAAIVATTLASVAHADGADVGADDLAANAVSPIITSYPEQLLNDAADNLTDANQVLAAGTTDIPGLSLQPDIQDHAQNLLAALSSAESSLSSYDNGVFADVLNPWFNAVDQGWSQGTDALLNADKAVESAISAGSGVDSALLSVLEANVQLAGDAFNGLPIEFVDGLIDPSMLGNLF